MNPANGNDRCDWIVILAGAVALSVLTVRPYASGWNDASRLATVETLVDRGTLIIDDSIFARPNCNPSPFIDEGYRSTGTGDKLLIGGHFYSHQSPVPAFGMAAVYQTWRWAGGPSAAERPDWFCRLINLTSAGLAYVVSVCCMFAIGGRLGLDRTWRLAFIVFFAFGTVALPYAQQVSNHVLLLAAAAWLFLVLLKCNQEGWTSRRMLGIGSLLGISYTIDLGAGPMLCLTIGSLLALESGSRRRLPLAILAGLPWFIFHHFVNYRIGGTFIPATAVPEYLAWDGSRFDTSNITGGLKHGSLGEAALYALDMLFGKKGFLGHNLVLFLPLVMLPRLLGKRYPERRIVSAGLAWAAGTWLLYAATSSNLSGLCCSVRWFVPLLVPGFVALGIVIRDWPSTRVDALILGSGGILLGCCLAYRGPWSEPMIFYAYWIIYFATLAVWGLILGARFLRPYVAVQSQRIDVEGQVADAVGQIRWGCILLAVCGFLLLAANAYRRTSQDSECEAENELGKAAVARGQIRTAIDHFQKALEMKPDCVDAHINLAEALADCGRVNEALVHYQKALEIKPDNINVHYNFAVALAGCGKDDEAIAHFRQALEIKPGYAEAHNNLGALLARRGQVDEAISHYEKALEIMPEFLQAHINLALALAGRNRLDESRQHFNKALALASTQDDPSQIDMIRAKMKGAGLDD